MRGLSTGARADSLQAILEPILGTNHKRGSDADSGLRRHHHRRGHVGPVPALPAARTRFSRARVRGRHRCRRHLVLEPLSRRALRFRKLFLRLFVLEGVAAGMGVVGAFCRPAGDAALSQLRRRQVRPAPRYPVSQPGDGGGLRRRLAELEHYARRRQPLRYAFPDYRDRARSRPRRCRGSRDATISRARRFTPRDGRRSPSISPASASP